MEGIRKERREKVTRSKVDEERAKQEEGGKRGEK